jgi:hypothetical protein
LGFPVKCHAVVSSGVFVLLGGLAARGRRS